MDILCWSKWQPFLFCLFSNAELFSVGCFPSSQSKGILFLKWSLLQRKKATVSESRGLGRSGKQQLCFPDPKSFAGSSEGSTGTNWLTMTAAKEPVHRQRPKEASLGHLPQ